MRPLFADGFNSAAHVGLGLLRNTGVAAVFVAYQLAEGGGENTPVDLLEFAAGWVLAALSTPL